MQQLASIKRGESIALLVEVAGETNAANLKAQVRTDKNTLIGEFEIAESPLESVFTFIIADTSNWPAGTYNLYFDIKRKQGTAVESTETILIPVKEAITL